jgi:hypothetical protein
VAIEGLIASHVAKKHITDVAAVYEKRWWDYRRLAPGHSFYLFANHYYKASRTAARKLIGERGRGKTYEKRRALLGPALVEMTAETIWDRDLNHITGIWKSMLVADALGIPYDHFCRMACQVAFDRLWEHLPRPTQLYSENIACYVMDEWDALRKVKFVAATHPVFDLCNYDARQMQDDYRAYVIEQISQLESGKVAALASVLGFRPQIPIELAEQHFPKQLIDRARSLAS